jgi:signal peptidase II
MKLSLGKAAVLTIFLVLLIDQCLKFWIKTHMILGQEHKILGDWFIIHFTENNGMAFGWEFGGSIGKLILSSFRIIAVIGITWYLIHLVKAKEHIGYIISISLILAGAVGNIIDSAFYGMIFSESYFNPAQLLPDAGGYSTFLHGKVVDMLYFPIIDTTLPSWVPVWGGEPLVFFRPVFNIADSAITIGVFIILIFQKRFFKAN